MNKYLKKVIHPKNEYNSFGMNWNINLTTYKIYEEDWMSLLSNASVYMEGAVTSSVGPRVYLTEERIRQWSMALLCLTEQNVVKGAMA